MKGSEKTNVHIGAVVFSLPFTPFHSLSFLLIIIFNFQFSISNSAQAQRVEVKEPVEVKTVEVPKEHSANKALLLSLLPGAGQIYNGQAWKVPVIYGAFAGMGYFIHYYYSRATMFKDEYLYRINHNDTPDLADYASYPTSNIYSLYNSYDRNFQLMVIITVGIYALNLIDAYVFGHLYDFQIDDNISMGFSPGLVPTSMGLQPTLGVTFSF